MRTEALIGSAEKKEAKLNLGSFAELDDISLSLAQAAAANSKKTTLVSYLET